jgi:hypothetical protein
MSLEVVTAPFTWSGLLVIEIDANHRHLSVNPPFLLDFARTTLIGSWGSWPWDFRIPESVRVVGDSAFRDCLDPRLGPIEICIPASVEILAAQCFANSVLWHVIFEPNSKLAIIEREAFAHCNFLVSFHIPGLVERIDGSAFQGTDMSEMTIGANNCHFSISGQFLLDFEGVSLIWCFGPRREVRPPKRIQRFCRGCFESSSDPFQIIFDAGSELSVIEEGAFRGSALMSISIPDSVIAIGANAFALCQYLKLIAFGAGSKLSDLGSNILDRCLYLRRIEIPGTLWDICQRGLQNELKRGIVTITN